MIANTGGHVFQGDLLQISKDLLEAQIQGTESGETQVDAVFTLIPTTDNPRNGTEKNNSLKFVLF